MNIIQIVTNKTWGGGEQYVLDLCRRLDKEGHSTAVLCREMQQVGARFAENGIAAARLPFGGIFDFITPSRLAAVTDRIDGPVIIHVHNFKDARTAVKARSLMRDPKKAHIICTRHLVRPGDSGRRGKMLYDALDAIIFVSGRARKEFLSSSPQVDTAKLKTLHNGITDSAVGSAPDRERTKTPVIIYAGRLEEEKGITDLINAFAALRKTTDARLRIFGNAVPRMEIRLKNLVKTLGIAADTEFAGFSKDIFAEMMKADIGVVPTRAPEAFGLTIVQMMAAGLPVVTTDNGAQPEIITDGKDGILVGPSDPAAIAAALKSLCDDPGKREKTGAAAALRAKDFSYDRFYRQITDIYEEVAEK